MADIAVFTVAPPMRCCQLIASDENSYCGELAHWERPSSPPDRSAFFCYRHRVEGDVPIGGALVFRRVTISLDVIFAGVALGQVVAQADALERLERAIGAAGGLLNLHAITSTIGRWSPPGPIVKGKGGRGREQ